jgi:6-phosphogluconolactonase
MKTHSLEVFPDDDALVAAVAVAWLDAVAAAARADTRHLVALSGGRVAKKLFAAVVARAGVRPSGHRPVEFFWADERCVPPTDPESNYRLARGGLLGPLGIAENQIHRIPGEDGPELAAAAAAAALCHVAKSAEGAIPVLDLVLLGMGEDGHVASLFPGDKTAATDLTSIFRPVRNAPKPPPSRVTLGMGPLVAARKVWVLVAGDGKVPALREAHSPHGKNPLARLIQQRPRTRIFSTVAPD